MTALLHGSTRVSSLTRRALVTFSGAGIAAALFLASPTNSLAEAAVVVPPPVMSEPHMADSKMEKAVLAGGCFWGVQGVFQHVRGVKNAVSGYAGGASETAQYDTVGSGQTGHAEAVEITFDPKIVSYGTLLQIYFSVAHNPTELNRQGPDTGTQYRSTIFAETNSQKKVAAAYIKQLEKAGVYSAPIVTTIETSKEFYPAEAYHQDYATLHPDSGYIARFDLPKIDQLRKLFPAIYEPNAKLVADAGALN